jgi:hypothetical protein
MLLKFIDPKPIPKNFIFQDRHFHTIHTQVVVDNAGRICHIQSGFLGHQNDAQQFGMMPQIGYNAELIFHKTLYYRQIRFIPAVIP